MHHSLSGASTAGTRQFPPKEVHSNSQYHFKKIDWLDSVNFDRDFKYYLSKMPWLANGP